jgi:hypothetical protein
MRLNNWSIAASYDTARIFAGLGFGSSTARGSTWHKCEVPTASSNVRVRGRSGNHMLVLSSSQFGPKPDIRTFHERMSGCKLVFRCPLTDPREFDILLRAVLLGSAK